MNKEELFKSRVAFLQCLSRLINNSNSTTSICIDAGWGYGKTFFLKKLKENLASTCHVVEYDAWKWDIESEPLVAILNEIVSSNPTDEIKEKASQFLKLFIPIIFDKVFPGAGKILEQCNFDDASTSISLNVELDKKIQKIIKEIFTSIIKQGKKKIVFLVDELDRCTPNYAIDILERFKHFFSLDDVCFIFAVNENQLEKSVEHIYGNIDANMYLEKFFDFKFSLPLPNQDEYCQILKKEFCLKESSQIEIESYNILSTLIGESGNKISLREIEKLFRKQKYLLSIIEKDDYLLSFSIPFVIFASEYAINYLSSVSNLQLRSSYSRNEQWAKDVLDLIDVKYYDEHVGSFKDLDNMHSHYNTILFGKSDNYIILLDRLVLNDRSQFWFDYLINLYSSTQY